MNTRTLAQCGFSAIFSVAVTLGSFSNVWPSYAIPMLRSDQSPLGFRITDQEANIISSLPMLGSLISILFTGPVAEAFGRKKIQILCGLVNLEALSALKLYRGESVTTEAIIMELASLKSQINNRAGTDVEMPILKNEKATKEDHNIVESTKNTNPWVLIVTVDYNRRAIIMTMMFMSLVVWTGMIAVQTYANQFFAKAVPSLPPDLCSVLLALVLILSNFITIGVTDLVSRRTLMTSTCSVASICLATVGASMRWSVVPVWLTPLAIVVYCIVFHLGVINIVFIQLSESFGSQINSAATPIALCTMVASNFMVLYVFGPAVAQFGIHVVFFFFSFVAGITALLSILFIKETRHVPLENIQKMYSKGFLCRRI